MLVIENLVKCNMVKEFEIRDCSVYVYEGPDLLDLFKLAYKGSYVVSDGKMVFDYLPLTDYDVLALYSCCVKIKYKDFYSYYFKCRSEFPVSLERYKRWIKFNPDHYVYCLASEFRPYRSCMTVQSLNVLHDFELYYNEKDSVYKDALKVLDSINRVYYVTTSDCKVNSCDVLDSNKGEFYTINYSIGLGIKVNIDGRSVILLIGEIGDDRIHAVDGGFHDIKNLNTAIEYDDGSFNYGSISANFYLREDGLIMEELSEVRDRKRKEILGKITDYKRAIHKLVSQLNVINS